MRWTEKEAIERGFWKDEKGEWHSKSKSASVGWDLFRQASSDSSVSVPVDKSNVIKQSKKQVSRKKRTEVGKPKDDRRFEIAITSYSRFHTDPDNLGGAKYAIDELVRAGLLPGDSSRHISQVSKRVEIVKTEEEERTEIVVICLPEKQ